MHRLFSTMSARRSSGPAGPRLAEPSSKPLGAPGHFPASQLAEVPPDELTPWAFPSFLGTPRCRWLRALREAYRHPVSFPASISPDAGILLHSLIRNIRPRIVVETGTFLGISTVWIAAALADLDGDGVVHSFDDFGPISPGPWRIASMAQGRFEFVDALLRRAGLRDRVVLHVGDSADSLRACTESLRDKETGCGVQLAFLDADHSPAGIRRDFDAVHPLLDTGGYLLLHDVLPTICGHQGPRLLFDDLARHPDAWQAVDIYLAPVNYGFGLLRRLK